MGLEAGHLRGYMVGGGLGGSTGNNGGGLLGVTAVVRSKGTKGTRCRLAALMAGG
jgi:hypothetical protein